MKASELMVGDWVFTRGQIEQVTSIYDGYICTEHYEDSYDYYFEPIPITPEILEKNGFVQNPRSKSRRSHQICTDSVYISWWRGRLNILFKPFIGHSTNHVNVDGKYVHELQHALRICGIEKEIVL